MDDDVNDAVHPPLRHIRAGELSSETAQSGGGMHRFAAISGDTTGSAKLWMGEAHVEPGTRSSDHHHGDSETAIYVLGGSPEFVFLDPESGAETRILTAPGDYVFVPSHTPHREENNHPDDTAVVVLARSTQEAIVVNLPSLDPPR
ncbi:MAG: hypothetical protein JWP74_2098 [Marmoricola sp.]|nr:hypothetical protein [Marmoricola sp.]